MVRLLTLAHFYTRCCTAAEILKITSDKVKVKVKCMCTILIFFYFPFLLLQKWRGLRTRYQPSLVTGHVCCSITCHAIAVLTAVSRHVQPAALCSAVMQWAAAALQHLQSCVMDRDYLLYWQLPVSLAPRSWSHVTAAAILIQCSCAVR